MSKPTISKKSLEHMQEHMKTSNCDWYSSEIKSRERKQFKSSNASGMSLIHGGLRPDPSSLTGLVWCRFNDLDGMTQSIEFIPYWLPEDCKQCYQQCFMHFNQMLGLSPWAGLKPVRDAHVNKVLPGRLPEED